MSTQPLLHRLARVLVIANLLLGPATSVTHAQTGDSLYLPLITTGSTQTRPNLLFRTQVTVSTPAAWHDLARLGVLILEKQETSASLLVDDRQLADLARLRYNPEQTNALATLSAANATLAATAGMQGLLGQEQATWTQLQANQRTANPDVRIQQALYDTLHTTLATLTAAEQTQLAQTAGVDSDNDGLSDDQEGFWCTNPNNPNSDNLGPNDGAEVKALKDWMQNKTAQYPSTGAPFAGWPVRPDSGNCLDGDQDAVPDQAEERELGLNPNRESTDYDKFDDGQELYGTTYCPGGGGFCGYGVRPRNEDWGTITAQMPSWVKAPGNHPLVAAFPVPEVDVVQSSFHVQTVEVVTTDHVISSGTEKSYSTATTDGTSTSQANTITWNDWEETAKTTPVVNASGATAKFKKVNSKPSSPQTQGSNVTEIKIANFADQVASAIDLPIKVWESGVKYGEGLNQAIYTGYRIYDDIRSDREVKWPKEYLDDYDKLEEGQNRCTGNCGEGIESTRGNDATQYQDYNGQNYTPSRGGRSLTQDPNSVVTQRFYPISYPSPIQVPTLTKTNGHSWGGAQTTTTEQYQEHTVTNSEAFSSGESWGTATAVDSTHAADLWFTYKVRNVGTEYAREIGNLAFNIYISDDPNPAITYFVAPDIGGNGKFQNFMPNEEHPYTSRRIPLSLEQMKAIDLGGPIRIVVEDFTYGVDELFYQDAANAGVLVALEDGTDDGDEAVDNYLIPTWGQETVLNVLARYFPHQTDANGTIIAIWTPEYRTDTPAWCQEPKRPSDYPNKAVWCKHVLSTADWWNVYTDGLGDGSEGFQDTPAAPGSVALFRFNQDSDLDGFSDRSEARLGTDANDASSFPHPELLAGLHNIKAGNKVTSTLSLLNTGIYDAYGVEAVMVAPDDSINITNNTVGGSGRVRALKQVLVGSRIQLPSPLPGNWTQTGHAVPAAGGYYTGSSDRTYTFTVVCGAVAGCAVGNGAWGLNWNDGQGASGQLNFSANYQSPNFLSVGNFGVTLAFYSGKVSNGESFTVQARTPRDTFQYTINREPYTPPLVIVSYNDPQGNHRFVIPSQAMNLTAPTDNLNQFAGEMLYDAGVELVTGAAFAPGANSAKMLVNNPTASTLSNAHLFLEVINISGTVVAEIPTQVTLPPGPTYTTVTFNTSSFTPAYQAAEDYIVMAFLTDYQGNILDTAGRPLSSFQVDPLPQLAADNAALTWNFGAVSQGTLVKYPIKLANTGFGRLYTYLPPGNGLSLNRASRTVGAADISDYELALRTAELPLGPYDRTITVATSDPNNPTRSMRVVGTITAGTGDAAGGSARPLDVDVNVSDSHNQGEWYEFNHNLGPEPQSLHPVKVYNQDYGTMFGVGKYATNFGQGTASYDMFGDGRDGVMPSSGNLDYDKGFGVGIVNSGSVGSVSISVTDAYGISRINPGDVVLIHQTQGDSSGCWELNKAVADFTGNGTFVLNKPMQCNYYSDSGNNHAQILRVPQYSSCNVTGTVTPLTAWNGSTGGIFAVICAGTMGVLGRISADGYGFRGGPTSTADTGRQGEGQSDGSFIIARSANGIGGGGGWGTPSNYNHAAAGGGGGGHATAGTSAANSGDKLGGGGGGTYGTADLSLLTFGGGGGAGGAGRWDVDLGGAGGRGGGILVIFAHVIDASQSAISSNGATGSTNSGGVGDGGGGGGGAGGSIMLKTQIAVLDSNRVTAKEGFGGQAPGPGTDGGNGGVGHIRIEYCESLTGSTNPPASMQKLDCYITEQVETIPYTTTRLNLPETLANSRIYNVQFGRKLDFATAGIQVTTLRVPAGLYSSVTLDALISSLPATATLSIDVGNDGSTEWSGAVGNNSTNASPDLASAFTAYWRSQNSPTSGTIDVPVKVTTSQPGQYLLTNFQLTTTGSRLRQVRLPVRTYTNFLLDFTTGTGGTVALDLGDNGSIDWSTTLDAPRQLTANLKDALNAYLAGKSGQVDVPLRFYISPFHDIALNDYQATATGTADLVAETISTGSGMQASSLHYNEGAVVPVQATLRNGSGADSGPVTAAFFATAPGWGDWYIGSTFVANIPANSSVAVSTQWNTNGFGSDVPVPVKVVVNPYGRTGETSFTNNSKSTTATITPNQVAQTITFGTLADKMLNADPFVLTATASSGLAASFSSLTPTVCTVSSNTVTLIASGICTIQSTQAGNAFFLAASPVTQSFAVKSPTKTDQTITFATLPNKTLGNSPFGLTATASSGLSVSFIAQTPGVCTITGTTVTLVAAGTCSIQAIQNGDATYNPATPVTQQFTISPGKLSQTITFAALPDRTLGDPAFTLDATASSGLSVSFSSQTTGVCTVSGNTVTLAAVGTCTILASQAGNESYQPAAPVERSFVVNPPAGKLAQTISFDQPSDKTLDGSTVVLNATASSGLPVIFTSNTTAICTVSGNTVTLLIAGECSITATQEGNDAYLPATPVTQRFNVLIADPSEGKVYMPLIQR